MMQCQKLTGEQVKVIWITQVEFDRSTSCCSCGWIKIENSLDTYSLITEKQTIFYSQVLGFIQVSK